MQTKATAWVVGVWVSVLFVLTARAQPVPRSGLYSITSGRYAELGGFVGTLPSSLPQRDQAFVRLDVTNNSASMAFLGNTLTPFTRSGGCPPQMISFTFNGGIVTSNQIRFFGFDPFSPPAAYTVTFTETNLSINGRITTSAGSCADVVTGFIHTNVVAVLPPPVPPTPAVRFSGMRMRTNGMELCWNSISNRSHQVQCRAAFDTNSWVDVGPPILGNGSIQCTTDIAPPGPPRRFYRVLVLP